MDVLLIFMWGNAMQQASSSPTRKVLAATLAAIIVPYLLYLLSVIFPQVPLPDKSLVQTIVESLILGVGTFVAGYQVAPAAKDGKLVKKVE